MDEGFTYRSRDDSETAESLQATPNINDDSQKYSSVALCTFFSGSSVVWELIWGSSLVRLLPQQLFIMWEGPLRISCSHFSLSVTFAYFLSLLRPPPPPGSNSFFGKPLHGTGKTFWSTFCLNPHNIPIWTGFSFLPFYTKANKGIKRSMMANIESWNLRWSCTLYSLLYLICI